MRRVCRGKGKGGGAPWRRPRRRAHTFAHTFAGARRARNGAGKSPCAIGRTRATSCSRSGPLQLRRQLAGWLRRATELQAPAAAAAARSRATAAAGRLARHDGTPAGGARGAALQARRRFIPTTTTPPALPLASRARRTYSNTAPRPQPRRGERDSHHSAGVAAHCQARPQPAAARSSGAAATAAHRQRMPRGLHGRHTAARVATPPSRAWKPPARRRARRSDSRRSGPAPPAPEPLPRKPSLHARLIDPSSRTKPTPRTRDPRAADAVSWRRASSAHIIMAACRIWSQCPMP